MIIYCSTHAPPYVVKLGSETSTNVRDAWSPLSDGPLARQALRWRGTRTRSLLPDLYTTSGKPRRRYQPSGEPGDPIAPPIATVLGASTALMDARTLSQAAFSSRWERRRLGGGISTARGLDKRVPRRTIERASPSGGRAI
ncbi:hypothetical protein C8Q77DRAFT_768686 [Trametes polyzona]|nr:hypothetical protein C8Q77DRAFT_768686 [Trametes polyzona]